MKTINLVSQIINDKYTEYVYDAFDIQDKEKTSISIPYDLDNLVEFDWNIGVIVGGSGSGKTSILKTLGDLRSPSFKEDKALISNFDWLEPKDAALILTSIGLSSVPTWLRPFSKLSNGEQYRASLAYLISSSKDGEVVLIDEYTSVVDRDVAKAMSYALQKFVRRENKKVILASCHYDILEWLMPDWTCSPQKGGALERGEWLRQGRPAIELQVSRVKHKAWDIFKNHHYLSNKLSKSFSLLLFEWNNNPVAICVYASMPSGTLKNGYRLSRTVVLPDFQGIGIGKGISNFTASILKNNGYRVFTKTVNPALGIYRDIDSLSWKPTSKNRKERKDKNFKCFETKKWKPLIRLSYCHEYIGEAIHGYDNLLMPINHYRTKNQLTLF
jgi:ABC-type lipoprotein export system ATPase subunit/GNAT superfamily N-acetyltransferase